MGRIQRLGLGVNLEGSRREAGAFFLDSIELAAGTVTGSNELEVQLMTDASGIPGSVIESYHLSNAMGDFGALNPLLAADSVSKPVLNGGTQYWLIASTPTGPDAWSAWNFNSPEGTGLHALRTELG